MKTLVKHQDHPDSTGGQQRSCGGEGGGGGNYRGLFRTGGLMLYLSPSCGAAGIFLAGTGLGASISSPATERSSLSGGGGSGAGGASDQTYRWSGSWRGWGRGLSACPSSSRHHHFCPSRWELCSPLSCFSFLNTDQELLQPGQQQLGGC